MIALGKHLTVECFNCDEHIINSVTDLEQACLQIVKESGADIVKSTFQRFEPQGISGVVVISQSHFTIHTWPEHRYAAVDFFTCGSSISFERGIAAMKSQFKTDEVIVSADLARGVLGNNGFKRHGLERYVPVCEDSKHVYAVDWREKFEQSKAWGILSSVDVYHCDPEKIRDAECIRQFVLKLCDRIEMRRFQDTVVVNFGEDERIAGFSMTQLIESSLISGHFANQTNAAYVDIFSCKFYEPREAAEFALQFFGGKHYQLQVALRQ